MGGGGAGGRGEGGHTQHGVTSLLLRECIGRRIFITAGSGDSVPIILMLTLNFSSSVSCIMAILINLSILASAAELLPVRLEW